MSALEATHRYLAAWNAHDVSRLGETFRSGGTYEDPSTGRPLEIGGLGLYVAGLWAAFPDLIFEEVGCREIAPGEILVRWIMRGTNSGPLRGLPATGRTIALPGVDFITACEDGIQSVKGYFDRATLMEQLGLQVNIQPHAVGPVEFGVCSFVRSDNPAPPGAVSLTMVRARSDAEVERLRDVSRRIMLALRAMPGFLCFQGAVIGRRLTTVTLWESREAQRQVMRQADHKQASLDMFDGAMGGAFHASSWARERLGELWMRCESCGELRDAAVEPVCRCGVGGERPVYW